MPGAMPPVMQQAYAPFPTRPLCLLVEKPRSAAMRKKHQQNSSDLNDGSDRGGVGGAPAQGELVGVDLDREVGVGDEEEG